MMLMDVTFPFYVHVKYKTGVTTQTTPLPNLHGILFNFYKLQNQLNRVWAKIMARSLSLSLNKVIPITDDDDVMFFLI